MGERSWELRRIFNRQDAKLRQNLQNAKMGILFSVILILGVLCDLAVILSTPSTFNDQPSTALRVCSTRRRLAWGLRSLSVGLDFPGCKLHTMLA